MWMLEQFEKRLTERRRKKKERKKEETGQKQNPDFFQKSG